MTTAHKYYAYLLEKKFIELLKRGYAFPKLFRDIIVEKEDEKLLFLLDNDFDSWRFIFKLECYSKIRDLNLDDDIRSCKDWIFQSAIIDKEYDIVETMLKNNLYCALIKQEGLPKALPNWRMCCILYHSGHFKVEEMGIEENLQSV